MNRRSRGHTTPAGAELTLGSIAHAALEAIARAGVDALSRAEVADVLGVSVRSLYRLTPTVDHLIAAAAVEWQRRWMPPPDTGDWVNDLKRWCVASRAHVQMYPGLSAALQRLPPDLVGDATDTVVHAVVARLEDAGFDASEARALFGVLSMYAVGWAVAAPVGAGSKVAVSVAGRHSSDEGFELGLDLLLEGIAARTRRWR